MEKGLLMFYVGVGIVVRLRKEFFFVKDVFVLIVIDDVSVFYLILDYDVLIVIEF